MPFWLWVLGYTRKDKKAAIRLLPSNVDLDMIKRPVIFFIIFTYLISWSLWGVGYYLGHDEINTIFLVLGSFGPAIASIIIEGFNHSTFFRLLNFSTSTFYYFLSVIIFPILFTVLIFFLVLFKGYPDPSFTHISLIKLLFLIPVNIILGGALTEEIGWRGFLLLNLKKQFSNMVSSVIVGIIWALWHLPLFFTNTYQNPMMQYLIIVVLISFIFTFLFNRTTKTIWPVVLLHASFNISNMIIGWLFPKSDGILKGDWDYFILLLVIIILLVYVFKRLRLARDVNTIT